MKNQKTTYILSLLLLGLLACSNGGRGRLRQGDFYDYNGNYQSNYGYQNSYNTSYQEPAPQRGVPNWYNEFPSYNQYQSYLSSCLTYEGRNTAYCQNLPQMLSGMRGLQVGTNFTPYVNFRDTYGASGRISHWRSPYTADQISSYYLNGSASGVIGFRSKQFRSLYPTGTDIYCQQEITGIPCEEVTVDPMKVYCVSGLDEIQYRYEIGDVKGAQNLSYALLPNIYRMQQGNGSVFHNNLSANFGNIWSQMKNAGAGLAGSFVQSLGSIRLAPVGQVGLAPMGNIQLAPTGYMSQGLVYGASGGSCANTQSQMIGYEVYCVQRCVKVGGC